MIWSHKQNYFIFIGYLKWGAREGIRANPPEPPLDPPLRHILENHPIVFFLLVYGEVFYEYLAIVIIQRARLSTALLKH